MMDFRFFLTYKGITTEVDEPIGFDSMKATFKRSEDTHGLTFEISYNSLEFYGAGYKVISDAFKIESTKAKVEFLVEYRCSKDTWAELYRGYVKFRTYEEITDDYCRAIVQIGAEGLADIIAANWEKSFAVPLNTTISLPPKTIKVVDSANISEEIFYYIGQRYSSYFTLPFDNVKTEFGEIYSTFNAYEDVNAIPSIYTVESKDIEIIGQVAFYINVINLFIRNQSRYGIDLPINTISLIFRINNNAEEILFTQDISIMSVGTIRITTTKYLSLNSGDRLYLYVKLDYKNRDDNDIEIDADAPIEISATVNTQFKSTKASVSNLIKALNNLAMYSSNNQLGAKSDYYSTNNRAITNGLQVRAAKMQDGTSPNPFISLKSLFESLRAIDNIGMGIEGNSIILEPAKYFYKGDILLVIENANKITRRVRSDDLYNRFLTGYTKWESDGVNGLDAFCTKREYSLSEETNQEFTQKCELIADSYAVESTRRKQLVETTDWKYDSENFIICLNQDDTVEQGATGENLIDPGSVYNARISPARMAMRWFGKLMSFSRTPNTEVLKFSSADGNYVAKISMPGTNKPESVLNLSENADITADMIADDLWSPIFKNEEIEVEYPLTFTEFTRIKANPLGIIMCEGEECWIKEIDVNFSEGLARFTLLPKYN